MTINPTTFRTTHNLTRQQWSEISGVSVRSIKAYETGENPTPDWYFKLCEWYAEKRKLDEQQKNS